MRIVVQRVQRASCSVNGEVTGAIDKGFLIFIGYKNGDTAEAEDKLFKKLTGLRVFEDENGKMNRSLKDVNGSILAISQFTLYADCKKGNRPSFTEAMHFEEANNRYLSFCSRLREAGFRVEMGVFGADMKISLINDGPVTIILDSDNL